MATPTIDRIRHLKDVGVFGDVGVGQGVPFKRYNLVYGFNGCGKTTLSRLLSSLSENGLDGNLADGAQFSFAMSDGSTPSHSALGGAAARFLAVFNEDYVERTLTWKAGSAKPIIYLGAEQAALAEQLNKLEADEQSATHDYTLKSAEWSAAHRALDNFCRDAGRLIAEELNLGRRYTAANVRSDYGEREYSPSDKIGDDERRALKEIVNRTELPDKLSVYAFSGLSDALADRLIGGLSACISDIAIEALQRRKDALPWAAEGLALHESEFSCLFCGADLQRGRLAQLHAALQSGFDALSAELDSLTIELRKLLVRLSEQQVALRSPGDSLPSYRKALGDQTGGLADKLAALQAIGERWLEQVNEKKTKPDVVIPLEVRPAVLSDGDLAAEFNKLNDIVNANNKAVENFYSEQAGAAEKLKLHFLADRQSGYRRAIALEADTLTAKDNACGKLDGIKESISAIKNELRSHGPAAAELNKLLKGYLGHDQITLVTVDDGYRICRNGTESTKPLSEGEKTAVAFCYFVTSLKAEGRQLNDVIAVLDDPISSLDTRAMTHVVSMTRRIFEDCAQLFILTHNLEFMREMKKWLGRKKFEENSSFMFIETGVVNGHRISKIVNMPRLIREYESEYHYLYSLVKILSEDPQKSERFAYLMPNAIRKVLDIFLAFKSPGGMGLSEKVDKVLRENDSLDAARVKAMEGLAHLESHSESVGDVVTFSAYTLEQVSDAARCLLELIQALDPEHRKAMDKLCKP